MSTLDPQQSQDFQRRLRARAEQLREEIRSTMERSNEESPGQAAEQVRDPGDESFSTLIVDVNLSEVSRDSDELKRIDGALTRLAEGSYGMCADCGQEIPLARLQAEPTAERCVRCQELFEKTHLTQNTPRL